MFSWGGEEEVVVLMGEDVVGWDFEGLVVGRCVGR